MRFPRYLLLNPRYRDLMRLDSADAINAENGLYAVKQPHLHQPAHWALRLIDLQQRPDVRAKMPEWIDNPDLYRDLFCGWLVTDATPEVLTQHLKQQMLRTDLKGQRQLLRYFDPDVLSQLVHVLDDAQLYALMGPISQWQILDLNRRMYTINRSAYTRGPVTLSKDQWAAIANIPKVTRLRRAWHLLWEGAPLPDNNYQQITT